VLASTPALAAAAASSPPSTSSDHYEAVAEWLADTELMSERQSSSSLRSESEKLSKWGDIPEDSEPLLLPPPPQQPPTPPPPVETIPTGVFTVGNNGDYRRSIIVALLMTVDIASDLSPAAVTLPIFLGAGEIRGFFFKQPVRDLVDTVELEIQRVEGRLLALLFPMTAARNGYGGGEQDGGGGGSLPEFPFISSKFDVSDTPSDTIRQLFWHYRNVEESTETAPPGPHFTPIAPPWTAFRHTVTSTVRLDQHELSRKHSVSYQRNPITLAANIDTVACWIAAQYSLTGGTDIRPQLFTTCVANNDYALYAVRCTVAYLTRLARVSFATGEVPHTLFVTRHRLETLLGPLTDSWAHLLNAVSSPLRQARTELANHVLDVLKSDSGVRLNIATCLYEDYRKFVVLLTPLVRCLTSGVGSPPPTAARAVDGSVRVIELFTRTNRQFPPLSGFPDGYLLGSSTRTIAVYLESARAVISWYALLAIVCKRFAEELPNVPKAGGDGSALGLTAETRAEVSALTPATITNCLVAVYDTVSVDDLVRSLVGGVRPEPSREPPEPYATYVTKAKSSLCLLALRNPGVGSRIGHYKVDEYEIGGGGTAAPFTILRLRVP